MNNSANTSNSPLLRYVFIGLILVAVLAGAAYAAFVVLAGSGEASVEVGDVAPEIVTNTSTAQVYTIQTTGTEARFLIDETLNGSPFTPIGITSEVGGQLSVDLNNPSNSTLGTILINARTLATDSGNRNRAIRLFILRSNDDAYEFISFEPTSISGLPTSPVSAGDTLEFQVMGNLKIIETTQPVTFALTATINADNSLTGTARATVLRSDFGLEIPNAPGVANVSDEVRLELDFTALAQTND